MQHRRIYHTLWLVLAIFCLTGRAAFAENINPVNDGSKYAYGENTGWLNFQPLFGPGVTVNGVAVTGFAWGENIGWVNLSPVFGGVVNDGTGRLSGFAWAENAGWINFAPMGGGVSIDQCGDFNGTAWGENMGWIRFRSTGTVAYKVATSWAPLVDTFPPATAATAPGSEWRTADVSVKLSATDNACGSGVNEIHHILNSDPEVVTPGIGLSATITTEGIHSFDFFAVDHSGNFESSQSLTFRIDKTPPVISLTSPTAAATFFLNNNVIADYSANDPLSGVDSLSGTVPDGSLMNTATIGAHDFTVTATDRVGNSATTTITYNVGYAGNVDPENSGGQYAWAENAGWINFQPTFGPGVTVSDTDVSGFAWGENIGWINLSPTIGNPTKDNPLQQEPPSGLPVPALPIGPSLVVIDPGTGTAGVENDGTGNLSGFAWAENAGWINFAPAGGGVSINPGTGRFSGLAWGEHIGWLTFRGAGTVAYGVTTAWRGVVPPTPGDLDGDGDIDRNDLNQILTARNTPASGPDDPRDLNGDGMINGLDARKLVLLCTRPRCAVE